MPSPFAGLQYFPITLPARTVIGRLGDTAGATEAIPFATLAANLTSLSSAVFNTTADLLLGYAADIDLADGFFVVTGGRTVAGLGGGAFYYDASDTTSADDEGALRVDVAGRRWKIVKGADITPELYGALADGSTDDTEAFQDAFAYLASVRGGTLVLGARDYMVRTGPIIVPATCGLRGVGDTQSVFVSGTNTAVVTRILNDSNNHTIWLKNTNVFCEGIIFAGPQPVFQASISNTGTISGFSARYAGYGLTPGTYNLALTGGFGTLGAGTVTVDGTGRATSCAVTVAGSGYLGPSSGAGQLALPCVTATITGGNQTGAHILISSGVDVFRIADCAFISKSFGICCNEGHIVRNASASYAAGGNQVIAIASTTGIANNMLVNNVTAPRSLRQYNGIGSFIANTSITMSYAVDAASSGSADTLVIGTAVYFTRGIITGNSFWGTTYWQVYGNWNAENLDVTKNFFVNPESSSFLHNNALAGNISGNNVDGIYKPLAFAMQHLSCPALFQNNAIGNVTGSTAATTPGAYFGGRLVFGGSVQDAGMLCQGNNLYAPLALGIELESVVNATFIGNKVGIYDPTKIAGCLTIKGDSLSIGNTFIYGADAGPNATSYWSVSSRNWVIGPWGVKRPYRRVAADTTMDQYDGIVEVNTTAAGYTIKCPAGSGLGTPQAGLEFTVINGGNAAHDVTLDGNTDNIDGAATLTITSLKSATVIRSSTTAWFTTAKN